MLGLTDDEIGRLNLLSKEHDVIGRVLAIMKSIYEDPSLRLYAALAHVIDGICVELYDLKSKNIIGSSPKEDKIFERINTLITKLPDYQKASKSGQESLKTLGLVSEKDMDSGGDEDWAAKQYKKHAPPEIKNNF